MSKSELFIRRILLWLIAIALGVFTFYLIFILLPAHLRSVSFLKYPFQKISKEFRQVVSLSLVALLSLPYAFKFYSLEKDHQKDRRIQFLFVGILVFILLLVIAPKISTSWTNL